ncbi:unnamed protein product [marine sediment metagenome]|uniref:Uncharacterized protein n=1 Tax=marine sediment metagenome TaxID=412755 RepID=X1RFU7_9ZZZZ
MRKRYRPIDLSGIKTYLLKERKNKVEVGDFAKICATNTSFGEFINSLPRILAGNDFRAVVGAAAETYRNNRPIIFAIGAHVIKCGLSLIIIDLIKRGIVDTVAVAYMADLRVSLHTFCKAR